MNSKNNLEMNNKIEICNEGKKAYDIVLRDSFADLLDQMEFLEIEKKKVCIVTESNVAPIYLKEVCELISSKASKTITFSFEAGEKHKQLKTIEALYEELIINGQMDILDNPVYEMEFEIAGCEQTDGDEEDEQQKQFGNEQ